MSVSSCKEYFALVEKSEILDDSDLAKIRESYGDIEDPRQLASSLSDAQFLTPWQSKFFVTGRHRLKIGQYILLDRFQKDELGDRFLALHQQLDRKVDMHLFPANLGKNKTLFKEFLDQSSQVAKLDHPNLSHLYDVDCENDRYYFVFEHEQGITVEKVPIGRLSSEDIASLVRQSLQGLCYAHERDIIHGKLTESQLSWTDEKTVRIRNIGLADLFARLREANDEIDEFALPPQKSDDISAVGVVARKLFQQHIGKALTPSDQQLVAFLSSISKYLPGQSLTPQEFINKLDDWLEKHGTSQTTHAKAEEADADDRQEKTSVTSEASQNNQRRKAILALAASVILIASVAAAAWYFAGGDNQQVANNISGSSDGAEKKRDEGKPKEKSDKTAGNNGGDEPVNDPLADALAVHQKDVQAIEEQKTAEGQQAPNDKSKDDATKTNDQVASGIEPDKPNENKTFDPFELPKKNQSDVSANQPSENTAKDKPAEPNNHAVALKAPFADLNDAVDIPLVVKGTPVSDEQVLGKVYTGDNHLLGIDLIFDPLVAKQNVSFEMTRSDENKQLWFIRFQERSRDKMLTVAEIEKKQDDLVFRWLASAESKPYVNYLRNCLLKLMTRNETRMLKLRTPLPNESLIITEKKSVSDRTLNVSWLPRPQVLMLEILEFPQELLKTQYFEPADRTVSADTSELYLYLLEKPEQRVFAVKFSAKFGWRIKLESSLQMRSAEGIRPYKTFLFRKIGESVLGRQQDLQTRKFHADNYQPKQGEKTSHEKFKKDLSAQLDSAIQQVETFNSTAPLAEKLLNQPVRYRLYYEIDGIRIELVSPTLPVQTASK